MNSITSQHKFIMFPWIVFTQKNCENRYQAHWLTWSVKRHTRTRHTKAYSFYWNSSCYCHCHLYSCSDNHTFYNWIGHYNTNVTGTTRSNRPEEKKFSWQDDKVQNTQRMPTFSTLFWVVCFTLCSTWVFALCVGVLFSLAWCCLYGIPPEASKCCRHAVYLSMSHVCNFIIKTK